MSEIPDLITSGVSTEDGSFTVDSLQDATVILSLFLEEVRADEEIKSASSTSIEVFIKRAIYSLNKETPDPNESTTADFILPYVENQSGCALERVQSIAHQLNLALTLLESDKAWMSTIDLQDSDFVELDL